MKHLFPIAAFLLFSALNLLTLFENAHLEARANAAEKRETQYRHEAEKLLTALEQSNAALERLMKSHTTMTPNPSDLTPAQRQQINRFVAAKQGWGTQFVSTPDGQDGDVWVDPDGWSHEDPPDLFASLDACADVVKLLEDEQHHAYAVILAGMFWPMGWDNWRDTLAVSEATAPQRTLALYFTMGGAL